MKKLFLTLMPFAAAAGIMGGCGGGSHTGSEVNSANSYASTVLVADKASYHPQIVEPAMQDAWGLSLRPAGAGGHWWIASNKSGQSLEYIGDVGGAALHQDTLKTVAVYDHSGAQGTPSGVVFNVSGPGFVIDQPYDAGGTFTAPSKFLFATDDGCVNAWSEHPNSDGTTTRPTHAIVVWDQSQRGDQYFGMGISPNYDKVYMADFGASPKIVTLDSTFSETGVGKFANPYPGFSPWNIENVGTSMFVAYAKQEEPGEEVHGVGFGRIAEFDLDGNLIAKYNDRNLLNAPWGFQLAPAGFGLYSGKLLVSNFGDGTIAVFDPKTHTAIDYLRGSNQQPLVLDGIWDLKFGNGVGLGEANALYYTAGPNGEADGLFGKVTARH